MIDIKSLFFNPTTFFKKNKDTTYTQPMFIYVAITAVASILGILPYLHQGALQTITIIFQSIFGVAFSFAATFIATGIAHLGLMILNIRGYEKTYTPISYGLIVSATYSLIITILSVVFVIVTQVNYNTISETEILAHFITYAPYYLVIIALWIIGMFHAFYVQIAGVSLAHKITKVRAGWGIAIIPLIITGIMLIGFILLGITLVALFSSGFAP